MAVTASAALSSVAAHSEKHQLSREEAISCASLGVLHSYLADNDFTPKEGIDYKPRAKIWLQHAINVRPPEWQEERVVEEFKTFNDKVTGFMVDLFEQYQKDRTPEDMQAIVSALQGLKQNLAECDASHAEE